MHDDYWAGVESALSGAARHLIEAARSLQPPERTGWSVALESDGTTIVWKPWEEPFYGNVRSLLQQARSVPFVIESCFGCDIGLKELKVWFKDLSPDEQTRRRDFSEQFKSHRNQFREHNLTKAANIMVHRRGFAPIEGVVIGPSGKRYPASPTAPVPIAESPSIGEDAPPGTRIQSAIPVWPREDQFTIDGKSLFPELQAYLQLAHQLRDKARDICHVHDGKHLTPPPP